jgi:molecular chaperone Hsp33
MAESSPVNTADPGTEVSTLFVRNRNALVARATFSELYVDYYLHLGDHKIQQQPRDDTIFKRALAGFALHCASRPWNEMAAWTLHFQEPLLNVFLTGDNETGAITGRVFTENVKEMDANIFYSDVVRGREPKRRSAVNFSGSDPLGAAEAFYAQSEQRPARFFQLGEEEFVLVSAHPDYDVEWFERLTVDDVKMMPERETLVPMERRIYRWHCGCNQSRMMEVLAPAMRADPEGLFAEDPSIEIRCPRCGARHVITREALEAFVVKTNKNR